MSGNNEIEDIGQKPCCNLQKFFIIATILVVSLGFIYDASLPYRSILSEGHLSNFKSRLRSLHSDIVGTFGQNGTDDDDESTLGPLELALHDTANKLGSLELQLRGVIDNFTDQISMRKKTKKCKSSQNNVVFIKTHKTGSSTITSILNRYADVYDLSMVLPKRGLNRFKWPNLFRTDSVEWSYLSKKKGRKGNILANHARYNREEMGKVVGPGTKYITILRNPVTQFESSFYYFEINNVLFNRNGVQLQDPLSRFLKQPAEFYRQLSRSGSEVTGLLHNGMLYDLGLNTRKIKFPIRGERIHKIIDIISQQFDLVLITEYFDESLVLLMRTFCWTFEDILYLKQNARTKKRKKISNETAELIKKWNEDDYELYQTFNETFWKKIKEHGSSFWKDLKEFKEKNKRVLTRCDIIQYKQSVGNSVNINRFRLGDKIEDKTLAFCQKVMMNEIQYIQYFRQKYGRRRI